MQEALRLEEGHHRRWGKVWRAKSTGASGVMVQGCENWGRSKAWGKWQRTLWPPEPLAPGVVSPWPGSPWSSLQNMFSVPFSSEHGMEGDLVFISIVHMRIMVPQDTARKWHSRDLNLDSFFWKCLLFSWHLTVSVIAGWWPGRMSGSELSLAYPSCGPCGCEIYLVLFVPNSPLYYSLGRLLWIIPSGGLGSRVAAIPRQKLSWAFLWTRDNRLDLGRKGWTLRPSF